MRKSNSTEKTVGLNDLAAVIGVDKGQLSHESKRRWFPVKKNGGWLPSEVKVARARNVRKRHRSLGNSQVEAVGNPDQGPARDPVADVTEKTALEIARMAVQLCWLSVQRSAKSDMGVSPTEIDALKKSLAELRQGEADHLELEKAKLNLVERSLVREMCGNLASRLVRCVGVLEHSIGTEFAVWLADPVIQAMATSDRTRKVMEFVRKTCDEVRRVEADAVIKELLEQES